MRSALPERDPINAEVVGPIDQLAVRAPRKETATRRSDDNWSEAKTAS